jgi:hypothetical protein
VLRIRVRPLPSWAVPFSRPKPTTKRHEQERSPPNAPPHFVQHATMMQLQQGFAIRVIGLRDQVARRQFCVADVAEGSEADIGSRRYDVRFTPKSGHSAARS